MLPRRRKPSPTGKVDRAQPGPDEGKQPKSEKQATLNGSVFHSTWPVSLLWWGPAGVTPYGVPPCPWGKATSRRGKATWRGKATSGGGKKSPRRLWWQLPGGEERKELGLLVVPAVVDEAAVGDTLENWECYTRMKGVELII